MDIRFLLSAKHRISRLSNRSPTPTLYSNFPISRLSNRAPTFHSSLQLPPPFVENRATPVRAPVIHANDLDRMAK